MGGQAGRPAAGKGPLCRLCVGLPPRVVSPVRVGQSGAGRPGGGVGRASGDPFAVLPPRPVRAMRGPSGGAGRRPGVAAGRCCRLLWPCRGDCASGAVRAPGSRRIELRQNRCRGGRPGRGGRGIAVPSPAAVGPGRPGRCRVPGAECRVPGAGCRVPGAGCRVPGADAACRVLRAGPAGRDPEEGASRHDGRTSRAGEVGGFAGGGGMMAATTTRPHRSRPRYSHPVSFEGPSASWPTRPEAARAVLRQRPRLCPQPLPPVSQGEVQASCHGSIDLSRDFLFGRDFLYLQDQLVQPLHRGSARARGVPRCAL